MTFKLLTLLLINSPLYSFTLNEYVTHDTLKKGAIIGCSIAAGIGIHKTTQWLYCKYLLSYDEETLVIWARTTIKNVESTFGNQLKTLEQSQDISANQLGEILTTIGQQPFGRGYPYLHATTMIETMIQDTQRLYRLLKAKQKTDPQTTITKEIIKKLKNLTENLQQLKSLIKNSYQWFYDHQNYSHDLQKNFTRVMYCKR